MPLSRNSDTPPPTMTWPMATPVIAVAGILDLIRMFFEMFWFFGPELATAYCSKEVGGTLTTWTAGLLGSKTAALACGPGAAVIGFFGAGPIEIFGTVMAMAVGFLGGLILLFWLLARNRRIFKSTERAALKLAGGFLVSELPLIGTFPAFSVVLWRLYKKQIAVEKVALAAWNRKNAQAAAARVQARQQQAAELMQANAIQTEQMQQQEATNDAQYAAEQQKEEAERVSTETEAANDDQYTQTLDNAA